MLPGGAGDGAETPEAQEPTLVARVWAPAEILACIQRFNEIHGRPPRVADWNPTAARRRRGPAAAKTDPSGDWPHANTVRRIFGSWNAAVRAAGLPETLPGGQVAWTRAAVLEQMRQFTERYGEPPRVTDWNPTLAQRRGRPELAERFKADGCWPHANTVQRLFGSWTKALEEAGLPEHVKGGARARSEWLAEGLVSAADIAEMAGVSRFTIRRPLTRSGLRPVETRGRVPLYRREQAESFARRLRDALATRAEAREARRALRQSP